MHQAAKDGDVEGVRDLIQQGESVDIRDDNLRRTPLHYAAEGGWYEVAKLLISSGCDFNLQDGYCRTPAILAAIKGKKDIVHLLLEDWANVDIPDAAGRTLLYWACFMGHADVVARILESGEGDIDAAPRLMGYTPLLSALDRGHEDIAELLIGKGADVHRSDKSCGWTALHLAAMRGCVKVVSMLLEKEVDIDAQDKDGDTPLHCAYIFDNPEVAKLLLEAGANPNLKNKEGDIAHLSIPKKRQNKDKYVLHRAAHHGDLEWVRRLIQQGVSVDIRDDFWDTPLHFAAAGGWYDVADFLISNKCDINLTDRSYSTPAMEAARSGRGDIVHLLLDHGAQVDIADCLGCTLLYWACWAGLKDVVVRLLESGKADINPSFRQVYTPLMGALESRHEDIAELLILSGADIHQSLWKSLHLAAMHGCAKVIPMLLQKGVDINAPDKDGDTPLHCACMSRNPEIAKQLLEAGADPYIENNKGVKALFMVACLALDEEFETEKIKQEELPPVPELLSYLQSIMGCRSVEEFHYLNRIEEGSYGVVCRARDKRTNEVVAIKRLKKEEARFPMTALREIDILMKAHHDNIVTVREIVAGKNKDNIYIVMDYVEHDLQSLMETMKQPFLVGEVKTLMQQLLCAVSYLHDNWILHRDLTTSNLLLSNKGILKVGDFSLARKYASPLVPYTQEVVTLWYRAPELMLGAKLYSTPIDMWSVGCIFGELLTMKTLFRGKSEIDQLDKVFKDLGTPSEKIWPGYSDLPLVKKVTFTEYSCNNLRSRFDPTFTDLGFDLLNRFLTYDPTKRITAKDAKSHDFFNEDPKPVAPSMFPSWPAKSEQDHRKVQSPKPPSGGSGGSRSPEDPFQRIQRILSIFRPIFNTFN